MTEYTTKDSGRHAQYDSGMKRDVEDGKPRFDLIRTKLQPYEEQMIYRYAMLLARGAAKYSARNWEEGDSEVELDRAKSSLLRHTEQLVAGETDEDHAAAVWFNTQAIEYFRWRIAQKKHQRAFHFEDMPNRYDKIIADMLDARGFQWISGPWPRRTDDVVVTNFTMHEDGSVVNNLTGDTVIKGRPPEESSMRDSLQKGLDRDQRSL